MTKVVINRCYGGFGLSEAAFDRLLEAKGVPYEKVKKKDGLNYGPDYYHAGHVGDDEFYISPYEFHSWENRADQDLVRIVEEMGEESWGGFAELKVVDIPDDVEFTVMEYDGIEWVAEKHRTWS